MENHCICLHCRRDIYHSLYRITRGSQYVVTVMDNPCNITAVRVTSIHYVLTENPLTFFILKSVIDGLGIEANILSTYRQVYSKRHRHDFS
jgi:hypothetical protein